MLNTIIIAKWLLFIAIAALVVLAIQDFLTWMDGGNSVIGDFIGTWDDLMIMLNDFLDWISSDAAIIKTLENIFDFDKYMPGVAKFFRSIDRGFRTFENFIKNIPSIIKNGFNTAIDFVTEKFTAFIQWFPAQLQKLADSLGKIPERIKGMIPQSVIDVAASIGIIDKPNENSPIEARADGGPVNSGQSYIVGEQGPELFTPGTSGNIKPNMGRTVNISSIVGSMTFNVSGSKEAAKSVELAVLEALNSLSTDVLRAQSGMAL